MGLRRDMKVLRVVQAPLAEVLVAVDDRNPTRLVSGSRKLIPALDQALALLNGGVGLTKEWASSDAQKAAGFKSIRDGCTLVLASARSDGNTVTMSEEDFRTAGQLIQRGYTAAFAQ